MKVGNYMARTAISNADKISKLESKIARYEQLIEKAKKELNALKLKQRETEIKEISAMLLTSGKSIEEIKELLK